MVPPNLAIGFSSAAFNHRATAPRNVNAHVGSAAHILGAQRVAKV